VHIFELILILLASVLLSYLINYFLPLLSVPVIQIILGVVIALVPIGGELVLEPEFIFIVFLAPLVFHSTMKTNKKIMLELRKPILMAAIVLVFITIVIVGYFTHWLIPAIPLAAAFALAAALGPTDVVAVEAISSRVHLPQKIIGILSGESIINDATGIVCFQLAIIAAATGSLNLSRGVLLFFGLSVGGIAAGFILTMIKFTLVRWLRAHTIENNAMHIAIGLLTPFIIYMVAEEIGVSGILAVFSAGLVHSLFRDKLNPEMVSFHTAQKGVWSLFSFSLDGIIFIVLGTQLPAILSTYAGGSHKMDAWKITAAILLITLALAVIRFLWWFLTVKPTYYETGEKPAGKIRSGLIFSLAGARGEIPLAIVLSIPLLLPDGGLFPQRDLITLIAGGVIVVSLLMTNFLLPLLVPHTGSSQADQENAARADILHIAAAYLKSMEKPESYAATEIVLRSYQARIKRYAKKRNHRNLLAWEKDVVLHMAESGQISESMAERYIEAAKLKSPKETNIIKSLVWTIRHIIESFSRKKPTVQEPQSKDEDEHLIKSILLVAANGFRVERILIKQMEKSGRISHETAKEMQASINLAEVCWQEEDD
jgi:CPA1 family monovalent cation:H+ antiporter